MASALLLGQGSYRRVEFIQPAHCRGSASIRKVCMSVPAQVFWGAMHVEPPDEEECSRGLYLCLALVAFNWSPLQTSIHALGAWTHWQWQACWPSIQKLCVSTYRQGQQEGSANHRTDVLFSWGHTSPGVGKDWKNEKPLEAQHGLSKAKVLRDSNRGACEPLPHTLHLALTVAQ